MYYVLHITKSNGQVAHEFFSFSSIEQAQEKYHALLAYDYNGAVLPNLEYFLVELLDESGLPVERKAYTAPVQPEPEPEEEYPEEEIDE